ncbi:MAG TPA: hypothetical protein VL961_03610 [Acidimicrobiales bacterium]|nr:hypothetical protein [Acidimicrobiales bacterium]
MEIEGKREVLTNDAALLERMSRPEESAKLAVAMVNPMLNGSSIRPDGGQRFAPK